MAREYPGIYRYVTKQGPRYRYNFRDSDDKQSCKRGFLSPQAAAIDKAGLNVQAAAGQHLIKSYLTQQRLRSDLTVRRIHETLEVEDLRTVTQLARAPRSRGGDWELLSNSGLIVQALLDARHAERARFDVLSTDVNDRENSPPWSGALRPARRLASRARWVRMR